MDYFDSLLNEALSALKPLPRRACGYDETMAWRDLGQPQVILQRDSAFELSGTGFDLVTSGPVQDGTVIVGDELSDIREDRAFTRLSVVQAEDGEDPYGLIKKIEYVKYHYFPDGYMLRSASRAYKEAVRVSRRALKDGIDFAAVGNLLIQKYKQIPQVKGVRVYFITDPAADHRHFSQLAGKKQQITQTLDHIMSSMELNCAACDQKAVCREVEGLRALHFRTSAKL